MKLNKKLYSPLYKRIDKDYLKFLIEYDFCMKCSCYYSFGLSIFTINKDKTKSLYSMCSPCKQKAIIEKYRPEKNLWINSKFDPLQEYKKNITALFYRSFKRTDELQYKKLFILMEAGRESEARLLHISKYIFK